MTMKISPRFSVAAVCCLCALTALVARCAETVSVSPVSGDATSAVQGAIDRAFAAGGGTVRLAGGDYAVKGLRLRSRVTLLLSAGARLHGSRDPEDYFAHERDALEPVPAAHLRHDGWTKTDSDAADRVTRYPGSRWNNGLIRLLGATDAAIVGEPGCEIDGCNPFDAKGEEGYRGPHGISAIGCTNLTLRGYVIRDTGNWAHRIADSQNVRVENVTCLAGHDGVHFNGCDDVSVLNCTFKTGDDCIAGFDNRRFVVRDCFVNTACSGFRFAGTDVLIERCTLRGPGEYGFRGAMSREDKMANAPSGRAKRNNMLSFFTYYADGTHPIRENAGRIIIRDSTSHGTDRLLHYNYGNERWQRGRPMTDITFERVTATGIKLPVSAWSDAAVPLALTFRDCRVGFDVPPAEFIRGAYIGSLTLENVSVEGVKGPMLRLWHAAEKTPALTLKNVTGLPTEVVPSDAPWKVRGI